MSGPGQMRALECYFDSLLLDEPPAGEPSPQPQAVSAPTPRLKPQAPVLMPPPAAPLVPIDARRERLGELLARIGAEEEAREQAAPSPAPLLDAPPARRDPGEAVESLPAVAGLALPEVAPVLWENLDSGDEFQALFFEVAGVTFAVPLTELGGIHRLGEVSALFGQPDWYRGIMVSRGQKMNVVDTARWAMPEQTQPPTDYHYLIMLGDSSWGLACHRLRGTEWLRRDEVKWRHREGKRPWLAGMVKEKMCALLHVRALLPLLGRGMDMAGRR